MKLKSAFLALALVAASSANANIILNGNFESGAFGPDWTSTGNVQVTGPVADAFYFGGGSAAKNGNFLVAFNSGQAAPNGVVSQTFGTSQGTEYAVTFDFGATSGGMQQIMADILGANGSVVKSFGATGMNAPADLKTFTFSFIANSNASTLRFSDFSGNNSINQDGLLDNVAVAAVPEPTSIALLGLGLLGVVASRRKSAKTKAA